MTITGKSDTVNIGAHGSVQGIKGAVTMKVVISAEGLPTRVDVAKSLSKERDEEAVATVKKWKFKPARTVDGDAVEATTYVEINFVH